MTPDQWLAPQPAPIKQPTGDILASLETQLICANKPHLAALFGKRHDQGMERYGMVLQEHNGRDVRCDLMQELVDAAAYAYQGYLEATEEKKRTWKILLNSLIKQMEIVYGLE